MAACVVAAFVLGTMFWWLGFAKGIRFFASGGSVGLATSMALFPFWFGLLMTGLFVIPLALAFTGFILELLLTTEPHALKSAAYATGARTVMHMPRIFLWAIRFIVVLSLLISIVGVFALLLT